MAVPAESSMHRNVAGSMGRVYSKPSEISAMLKNLGLGTACLCFKPELVGVVGAPCRADHGSACIFAFLVCNVLLLDGGCPCEEAHYLSEQLIRNK